MSSGPEGLAGQSDPGWSSGSSAHNQDLETQILKIAQPPAAHALYTANDLERKSRQQSAYFATAH
jgi:hypothetical protein